MRLKHMHACYLNTVLQITFDTSALSYRLPAYDLKFLTFLKILLCLNNNLILKLLNYSHIIMLCFIIAVYIHLLIGKDKIK